MSALWLLVACSGPELGAPLGLPQTQVEAALADKQVDAGEPLVLTVTVRWAEGWTPFVGSELPDIEGLSATLVDEQTRDGERMVSAQTWELRGEPGSYVIPPLGVLFQDGTGGERTLQSAALFADIGERGPSSELAPMALAPVPEPVPIWPFAASGALVLLGAGGLIWRRRTPPEPPPPPVPPHLLALRAWEALQADAELDDHARALGLSGLFRRYLEAVLPVPATTATSREILVALDLQTSLQARCKRLLTATDLIKFARKGGGAALFDELDGDLRAVIEATRPRPPQPEEPA